MDKHATRKNWLAHWAGGMDKAARRGLFGKPIALRQAILINGPRAGALEIDAGFDAGTFMRTLTADDSALLRQLIPFNFSGTPIAFMSGRCARIEAGWPSDLADTNITLSDLGSHPTGSGRWLVGRNERGDVLTAGLNDDTPHYLVSGTTGSGKTTALISAIGQLSQDAANRLILIDCKHGQDFRQLENVRGLVGPLADDVAAARSALLWAIGEMTARYSGGRDPRRLVIVVDEVQELADDAVATESLRRIITQGRGAHIHCILATQHPTVAALGDNTIAKNLVGRLALRVLGPEASRVAVGSKSPRADYLLGHGDCYVCAPTATHRVQCALFNRRTQRSTPDLATWPEAEGSSLPERSDFNGEEMAVSLVAAAQDKGRPALQSFMEEAGLGRPGGGRAARLLQLGREMRTWLVVNDYCLPARQDNTLANYEAMPNGMVVSVPLGPGQAGIGK